MPREISFDEKHYECNAVWGERARGWCHTYIANILLTMAKGEPAPRKQKLVKSRQMWNFWNTNE